MEIKNITLKNFLGYGDYDSSVDIDDKGLVAVVGPNGAGKSNFFAGLLWAIYGESPVSVDNVVNRYNKKNCKVSVRFIVGGKEYTVFRYRKHETHGNDLLIFNGDKNISLRGMSETQQLIQNIIQIPYKAMVSSLLFSTENYKSFLRAKPSERLSIIESVLSLKEITSYYSISKDLLKITETKLQDHIKDKEKLESAIEAVNETIVSYKEKVRKDLEGIKNTKSSLEREKEALSKKYDVVIDPNEERKKAQKYKETVNSNNSIEAQIKEIDSTDIESVEREHTFLSSELSTLLTVDIDKEREKIKNAEEVKAHNNNTKHQIELLSASIKTSSHNNSLMSLSREKEKIIKELDSISNSVCPYCGQDTNEKINAPIVKEKNNRVAEIDKEIDVLQKELESIDKENTIIEGKIKELKSLIKTDVVCGHTNESLDSIHIKISDKQKEIAVLQNKIENHKKIITIINNLRDKIMPLPEDSIFTEEELVEYEHFNEKIEKIQEEIRVILAQAKSLYDKSYVEELDKKIEKFSKAAEKVAKKIEEVNDEKKHYQVLADLFSNKEGGFKRFFIEKIITAFNNNINKYLPLFFEKDISIEFDKELTETIKYDGFNVEFSSFSSGQKTRIDLAIAFSLFLLVKAFFSSNINLMVFDEILDQNLDVEGVEAVMSIVEALSQEANIFIISHRDEYKDRAGKKIIIEQRDGFSLVKGK